MSIDGVVLSDVTRWLAQASTSGGFVVVGDKASGRTTTLRSVAQGLLAHSGYTVADDFHACVQRDENAARARSAPEPSNDRARDLPTHVRADEDGEAGCGTRRRRLLFYLDYGTLNVLARRYGTPGPRRHGEDRYLWSPCTCRTHTILVIDDVDVLCCLAGAHDASARHTVSVLHWLLGSLLRSDRCLLLLSVRSERLAALRSVVGTASTCLLVIYRIPALTAAAGRRVVRCLHDTHPDDPCRTFGAEWCEFGAGAVCTGVTSRRALLASLCLVAHERCTTVTQHQRIGRRNGNDNRSRSRSSSRSHSRSRSNSTSRSNSRSNSSSSSSTQRAVSALGEAVLWLSTAASPGQLQPSSHVNDAYGAALPTLYGLDGVYDRLRMMMTTVVQQQKQKMKQIAFAKQRDTYAYAGAAASRLIEQMTPVTGILLHGASGCGKSALVRQLAHDFRHVTFIFVECTRLFSKYLGDSEERLRGVYRRARANIPAVVVLDSMDVIAQSRGATQQSSSAGNNGSAGGKGIDVHRRMLACLLCELDGVSGNGEVLTIGMTSALHTMDSALLRQGRLETLMWIPPLSRAAALAMTRDFLVQLRSALCQAYGTKGAAGVCALRDEMGEEARVSALASRVVSHVVHCSPATLGYVFRRIFERAEEQCRECGECVAAPHEATSGASFTLRECVDEVLLDNAHMLKPLCATDPSVR